ncbi:MAG: hypothetical protein KDD40_05340 [Bdellovibrionales bacterium]|nr:hypothetical protein [Bdellovibrionales bacterium]
MYVLLLLIFLTSLSYKATAVPLGYSPCSALLSIEYNEVIESPALKEAMSNLGLDKNHNINFEFSLRSYEASLTEISTDSLSGQEETMVRLNASAILKVAPKEQPKNFQAELFFNATEWGQPLPGKVFFSPQLKTKSSGVSIFIQVPTILKADPNNNSRSRQFEYRVFAPYNAKKQIEDKLSQKNNIPIKKLEVTRIGEIEFDIESRSLRFEIKLGNISFIESLEIYKMVLEAFQLESKMPIETEESAFNYHELVQQEIESTTKDNSAHGDKYEYCRSESYCDYEPIDLNTSIGPFTMVLKWHLGRQGIFSDL